MTVLTGNIKTVNFEPHFLERVSTTAKKTCKLKQEVQRLLEGGKEHTWQCRGPQMKESANKKTTKLIFKK